MALALLLVGSSACADDLDGTDYVPPTENASMEATTSVLTCEQRGFVDANGRQWLSRPAVYDDSSGPPMRREPAADGVGKRPDEMSEEELAAALSPVVLWGECEYSLAEPDLGVAREAIARRGLEQKFGGYRGDAPSEHDFDEMTTRDRGVFGADDREERRDNTSYPMRTQVHISTTLNSGSATLIGRSTAIGAAHVVHSGFGWHPGITWSPGVDRRDVVRYPYKPGGAYPTTDAANGMRTCKLIAVPAGWVGSTDTDWDFAVFEFDIDVAGTAGCNEAPGQVVGWLAWGVVSDANTAGKHGYLYGYPGEGSADDGSGCGDAYDSCVGAPCWTPTIWGWGNTSLNPNWSYELEFTIDATHGQSGSGVYIKEADGTRRVIATLTGCWSPFIGADYNYGRRIDSDLVSFIRAYSAL